MAAQTGSTNFSGTMIDSIEIPTAILGFSTMSNWNKVFPGYRSSKVLPVWAAVLLFPVVGRSRSQSLSLNSPWSKTPGCSCWKRTHLLFFYLNSWVFFYPQAQLMCVKNRSAMRGLSMFSCFYCTCLSIRHKDRQQNAMDIRQNTVQSRQTKRHKVLSRVYTRATCCRQQNCCQFVASLLLGTKGYMLPRYNQHVACRTTLPWCKRGFT